MPLYAEKGNLDEDSYQKVESPVRDSAPDQGPPMRERQTELDRAIVTSAGNKEKEVTAGCTCVLSYVQALPCLIKSHS